MNIKKRIQTIRQQNRDGSVTIAGAFLAECVMYITLVANFCILLGNVIQNDAMVSLATRSLLLSVLFMGVYYVLDGFSHRVKLGRALFIGVFVFTIFVAACSGIGILLGKYVNIICFLMLPTYMILGESLSNLSRIKTSIYISNICYALLFIYLYFTPYAYIGYGEYSIYRSQFLTLGFKNPNETGMYLLVSFMILLITVPHIKNKLLRLVPLALAAALFYLIALTESRSCVILAFMFALGALLRLYRYIKTPIRIFLLILPLISIVVMVLFPDFFEQLIVLGEAADDGRAYLYKGAWKSLSFVTFVFGNLARYAGGNLHNGYLSVFIEYGIIVFLFFFAELAHVLSQCERKIKTVPSGLAYLGVFVIILHGVAEGTFFVSGSVFAGLAGLLFILMREEEEKE